MMNEIKQDAKTRMEKSVKSFEEDLTKIRTGRAHSSLLDHVEVEYYGSMVPLSQAANVSVNDYRSLSIQIWEKDMVKVIEKALINSDLGLTPNTAGQTIHINLPPLTEDRRKEMVKIVRAEGEQAKVAIRNIRRDANNQVKQLVADKEASEDDQRRLEAEIQKLTDAHIEKIDAALNEKEQELMEV